MSKPLLDIIQETEEKYDIDTESGLITRKRTGKIMGCKNKNGYIQFGFNNVKYYVHRIILTKYLGREIKEYCDHINHNTSDNRIINLREITQQENIQYQQLSSRNKSGFKGVIWNKDNNKWRAQIHLNKKALFLGLFDTAELAYEAYKNKAQELNKKGFKYHTP